MNFLVLLLVAVILRFTPWRGGFPIDVLGYWSDWVARITRGRSSWLFLILLMLPLPLLGAVLWLVTGVAYGALTLIIHTLLVLLCVGRSDPLGAMTSAVGEAWERGDHEAASVLAERDFGVVGDDAAALLQGLRDRMAAEACHGYFVPAFWYVLLGPVVAVGYRLAWLASQRSDTGSNAFAGALAHALEWLPVRLMGLSFALVGHFDATLHVLRRVLLQWEPQTVQLAQWFTTAALTEDPAAAVTRPLDVMRTFLWRAVLVWAVVIAFISLVG
ncbi:regulatory signaling modulator protein AmpE [Pseudomonas sp. OIL-1]|uniref:regulatory signaling modulator protein AmpE n=1 Tax=Pseudomonas sp. OIL-1 TaxID=2706126 RepID=UPI0013A7834B|nr:regulatory signaling modulator protein AmpE [Pseudomonas sp. OIL-1]QIB51241.1 regulatory signaling modulator protein AmpE [Pseudomonas sp. OIL-1]